MASEDPSRNQHDNDNAIEHAHDASLPQPPTDAQSATMSSSPGNGRILASDAEMPDTDNTSGPTVHNGDSGSEDSSLNLQSLCEPSNAVLLETSSTSRTETGPETELEAYEATGSEGVPHDTATSTENTSPQNEENHPLDQPGATGQLDDVEGPTVTHSGSESAVFSGFSRMTDHPEGTEISPAPQGQQTLPAGVSSGLLPSPPTYQQQPTPPISLGISSSPGGFPGPLSSASSLLPAPSTLNPRLNSRPSPRRVDSELILPRWQPDAEVTLCPICCTQFSFFVRKHHCRKCGRVICDRCSPHRIVIPQEFVVRAPGDVGFPYSAYTSEEGHLSDLSSTTGGRAVRLCNPCVPDPNVTPPRTQHSTEPLYPGAGHLSSHGRSQSSDSATFNPDQGMPPRVSAFNGSSGEAHARGRSATLNHRDRSGLNPNAPSSFAFPSTSSGSATSRPSPMLQNPAHYSQASRAHASGASSIFSFVPTFGGPSYPRELDFARLPQRTSGSSSSRDAARRNNNNRPLPATPRPIPEEDECPICHDELPSRRNRDFEALREAHITECIAIHSTTSRVRSTSGGADSGTHARLPPRPPRRTGMFPYKATEKDCVDDAECTICFEEYQVGVPMARLECLCRFHHACIAAWFEDRPGKCPVHQHDSDDRY